MPRTDIFVTSGTSVISSQSYWNMIWSKNSIFFRNILYRFLLPQNDILLILGNVNCETLSSHSSFYWCVYLMIINVYFLFNDINVCFNDMQISRWLQWLSSFWGRHLRGSSFRKRRYQKKFLLQWQIAELY